MILEIGGTDFTGYIQQSGYNILEEAEYSEWQDCNYRNHRKIECYKAKGQIEFAFASRDDDAYRILIDTIEESSIDGKLFMNLYIQNKNVQREAWMFYEFGSVKQTRLPNGYVITKVKLKVEEP